MQTGEDEEVKEEEPEPDDLLPPPPARASHARTTPSSLPVSTSLPPSCAEQARDHTGSSPASSRNGTGFVEEEEEEEASFCFFFFTSSVFQGSLPSASAQSLTLPSQEAVTSVDEQGPDGTREQQDSESAWAWQEPTINPLLSSSSSL